MRHPPIPEGPLEGDGIRSVAVCPCGRGNPCIDDGCQHPSARKATPLKGVMVTEAGE